MIFTKKREDTLWNAQEAFTILVIPLSGQTTLEVQVIYLGVVVTISAVGVVFIANRIKSRRSHL